VGTTNIAVTASFKTRNGGQCGGTGDCASDFCVGGVCCNSTCAGACNVSCQTGTCQPQAARVACGSIQGLSGTGSIIPKICDGQGNCIVPKIKCPAGGGPGSCDLTTNTCCYNGSDRDESCPTASSASCATVFGQNCAATADCPTNQYCCKVFLPSGYGWAICTTADQCTQQQYCDPTAETSGCLQGACNGTLCI